MSVIPLGRARGIVAGVTPLRLPAERGDSRQFVTNTATRFSIVARVHGGGLTGQAGAIRMALARALVREDETFKGLLGREGLLTRDPRMKERKKYGQPGARKRFQFSKR